MHGKSFCYYCCTWNFHENLNLHTKIKLIPLENPSGATLFLSLKFILIYVCEECHTYKFGNPFVEINKIR